MICRHGLDSTICVFCMERKATGRVLPPEERVPRQRPRTAIKRPAKLKPAQLRLPCVHLGEMSYPCPEGKTSRDIRWCNSDQTEWSRCWRSNVEHDDSDVGSCERCPFHSTTQPGNLTRHLLYHIYPIGGNGAWQRNVGRLVERLRICNGRKIVAIVTDPPHGRGLDPTGPHSPDRGRHLGPCDSADDVKRAFGHHADAIDFIEVDNDPTLREVATFTRMAEILPNGANDVTLYAQAKGTTRHPGHIANHWSDVQYIVYFDYWLMVEEQLKTLPVTGAFKKLGPGWSPEQSKSDWHYSGSWFWFRNADLFARDWRTIDHFWSGIEPYPSQQFDAQESGCLFHEAAVPRMNLYRANYWRRVVDPAFAKWRRENRQYETPF